MGPATSGNPPRRIGIIGAGRLGTSLGLALEQRGYALFAVASSHSDTARALVTRTTGARCLPPDELVAECDLVWLTVPDDALTGVCGGLPWRARQRAVHCSGALGLDALADARAQGALGGCLHPLQSFPERFAPERFAGIAAGVEGDGPLAAELEQLSRALGATPFSLAGVDRPSYHAAAVFTSNYLVALHAAAARAFELAGLPRELARTALVPLTAGAAAALRERPLEAALTGPIARGDVATVARHLRAMRAAPQLRALYAQLGLSLLELELGLPETTWTALEALLREAV